MDRQKTFESLYRKYFRRMVLFYIRAFHLSEEDAEELAQEAFLRFYEAIEEYRGEAEWALLEVIARNVAYNRIRSRNAAKRSASVVDIDDPQFNHEPPAPEEPDYAERETASLRRRKLYEAIAALPAGQRQCIQLWLDDMTYEEIAQALRVTMDAVRSRLRDAKRVLRARIGDDPLPEVEE